MHGTAYLPGFAAAAAEPWPAGASVGSASTGGAHHHLGLLPAGPQQYAELLNISAASAVPSHQHQPQLSAQHHSLLQPSAFLPTHLQVATHYNRRFFTISAET